MICPNCGAEMAYGQYGGYWIYECPNCGTLEDEK